VFTKAFEGLQEEYPFQTIFPATHGFGIGLLSKHELLSPSIQEFSSDIPFIKSAIRWDGQLIDLFVVHLLPPVVPAWFERRNDSLEELSSVIKSDQPAIIMGDFNLTPWSRFYEQFTEKNGLRSARNFRNGFQTSWYGMGFYLPIDHFFVSKEISVQNFSIGPDIGSDHWPLMGEFSL
jgi:endonuclease/exonuclease/phosphatase (EEP) superfamily protein YafD